MLHVLFRPFKSFSRCTDTVLSGLNIYVENLDSPTYFLAGTPGSFIFKKPFVKMIIIQP